MHIKFLKHGTGSARKAAAYVLAEKDHQGIERAGVEVLRGDPRTVAEVADSLPFAHRYRSGVIAWAPEDAPTSEQIEQTLNEFEELAFAGLEPDRYSWAAVKHTEHSGSVHIHILAARVDLLTGKAMNIAPPGWQKDFDSLRDALNYERGWARPDDPARSRLTTWQRYVDNYYASIKAADQQRAQQVVKQAIDRYGWIGAGTAGAQSVWDSVNAALNAPESQQKPASEASAKKPQDSAVLAAARNNLPPGLTGEFGVEGENYVEPPSDSCGWLSGPWDSARLMDIFSCSISCSGQPFWSSPSASPTEWACTGGNLHVRRLA